MVCRRCQEAAGCTGYIRPGVCGKQLDRGSIQDLPLLLYFWGVKNIDLESTQSAFLSSNMARMLADHFGIDGIGMVERPDPAPGK